MIMHEQKKEIAYKTSCEEIPTETSYQPEKGVEMGQSSCESQEALDPNKPEDRLFLFTVFATSILAAVLYLRVYGWLP